LIPKHKHNNILDRDAVFLDLLLRLRNRMRFPPFHPPEGLRTRGIRRKRVANARLPVWKFIRAFHI